MNNVIVYVLLALNIVQYIVNNKEKRDLLNRIMAKDYHDYIKVDPPKSRSFLKLDRGE